jgi:thiamine-monophosphate kinase
MLSEDELTRLVARVAGRGDGVLVGIGDDAAVLEHGLVVSTDLLVEGVHFDLARLDAHAVGRRAAAVNLSDLAAMGASAVCLVAGLGLPPHFDAVSELAAGLVSFGVPLAGGDLSRAERLIVAVTAVGRAERPVLRSGGRAGDLLVVTGTLGGQALSGFTAPVEPRLAEGRELARIATAMIDLSDGIAIDGRRLAEASGTGAVVELARLPLAPGATVEQAAAAGEDYELLAAVPPDARLPEWVTVVGRLTEGRELRLLDAEGRTVTMRGHDHFAA